MFLFVQQIPLFRSWIKLPSTEILVLHFELVRSNWQNVGLQKMRHYQDEKYLNLSGKNVDFVSCL